MQLLSIDLHKISLGALIIALGLLVDDAIIAVEMMVRKLEEGYDKVRAATFAYEATAMIHQPSGGAQGQASDIEIQAREILKLRESLNKILADRTGQPLEKIRNDSERDYFMSGQEAKEYGLIDQVLEKRS